MTFSCISFLAKGPFLPLGAPPRPAWVAAPPLGTWTEKQISLNVILTWSCVATDAIFDSMACFLGWDEVWSYEVFPGKWAGGFEEVVVVIDLSATKEMENLQKVNIYFVSSQERYCQIMFLWIFSFYKTVCECADVYDCFETISLTSKHSQTCTKPFYHSHKLFHYKLSNKLIISFF